MDCRKYRACYTKDLNRILPLPRKMARVFTTRKFCARYTQRLSTPYRTRNNVTKPHALHANRHWNLFEKCLKREAVPTKSIFSYQFSHEPQNLLHQNRCLVWWSVPRVPRNILREVYKMRPLPRETWLIGWKRRKKVSRLSDKTIFDTLWNMLECHKQRRLPRQPRRRDIWNF